jgi:hypothetical protein
MTTRPAVLRVVERLERTGPVSYSVGRPQKGAFPREHSSRDLLRAVQYGLVTRSAEKPYVYRVVPGWRDRLKAPEPLKCGRVSSVWDLAKGTV